MVSFYIKKVFFDIKKFSAPVNLGTFTILIYYLFNKNLYQITGKLSKNYFYCKQKQNLVYYLSNRKLIHNNSYSVIIQFLQKILTFIIPVHVINTKVKIGIYNAHR